MSDKGFTVEHWDYHRNGIGGAGFVVAIIQDHEEGARFLVTDFSHDYKRGGENGVEYGYTAVVDLDKAHTGNIYMYHDKEGFGGNAWRGDRLGDKYRPEIQRLVEEWVNG